MRLTQLRSSRPPGANAKLREIMTSTEAIAFVRRHGMVLESAHGPAPNFTEAVAGESIRGNWWSHPRGGEIFELTRAIRNSNEVLICRAVNGKITFVHQRLWPALVRLARRFPRKHLAQVRELHTRSGHHAVKEIPFPKWVPMFVRKIAADLSESEALLALGRAAETGTRDLQPKQRVRRTSVGGRR